jgi:low affinity Fe/Cu permease
MHAWHQPKHWFAIFAKRVERITGHPITFALAVGLIVVWGITGPLFGFSDTWQLVINTGTTIVTFLMVFLIQNSQNRDTGAIQTKLDELIRALEGAHNALLDIEELDEEEIEHIRKDYRKLASSARKAINKGLPDTDCAEVSDCEHEVEQDDSATTKKPPRKKSATRGRSAR